MKKLVVFIFIVACSYTACRWDYHLSNYLFETKYCQSDKIGLFVYEKVRLDNEYLIPLPIDKDVRDLDPRFIIEENLMIDREKFDRYYIYDAFRLVKVSDVGPINYIVTSVIRRSDNKLLGKAVSANSSQGWLSRKTSFSGSAGVECPSGRDVINFPIFLRSHYDLIFEIFTNNLKDDKL